ncbi:MAG TPA: hypothetical protein PKD92_08120 [Novosphingobium sp.]|nr:hypothetical protein [Novosphingobium sp.]HMP56523.1 hypothetical protein [Novosphingobium sp.]
MAGSKALSGIAASLRVLFGIWNLFFGIVFFFNWPIPQPMGHGDLTPMLNQALIDTGLFAVVKVIEIVVGLLLIFNRAVPLALCVYFPVTVVIFIVNMFLEDFGWFGPFIAVVYAGVHLFLFWVYRRYYQPMLVWNAPALAGEDGKAAA